MEQAFSVPAITTECMTFTDVFGRAPQLDSLETDADGSGYIEELAVFRI